MPLPPIPKHIKVLDEMKLLNRTRNEKYIMCRYNHAPCEEARKWINDKQTFYSDSFGVLADFLDDEK